jgi:acyl-CoA dehydrogenase
MYFALTDDQEDLRRTVRELAAAFTDDYWAACDERQEFPWEFYNAFAELPRDQAMSGGDLAYSA